jgi:hypothetical protein
MLTNRTRTYLHVMRRLFILLALAITHSSSGQQIELSLANVPVKKGYVYKLPGLSETTSETTTTLLPF